MPGNSRPAAAVAVPDVATVRHASPRREDRETFWRTLQTFSITRIVIAVVLLAVLGVHAIKDSLEFEAVFDWQTCIVYLVMSVSFAHLSVYVKKHFVLQLLAQLVVDVIAISLLYTAAGGAKSGLAILYLFPLAGCAILAPLMLALFFVSVVTLFLLAESGYQLLYGVGSAPLSQAGLYGGAFFAAIYLINRLAAKLINQEDLAAQRGRDLRMQEAINRLVIADMGDGILVVGRDTEVFAGNPAAERMLGMSLAYGAPRYKLTDVAALAPIANAFFAWANRTQILPAADAGSSTFVSVKPGDGVAATQGNTVTRDGRLELVAHLKLRFATVETAGLTEDRTVIFLQDVTEIENQAQQLKLASMGRLTASIAHEVRNPLSAISHAASLLNEDISGPAEKRLLKIVDDNVIRLNRMIEDILKLSRKAQSHDEPLQLEPFFTELLAEFEESHALKPGMIQLGRMSGCEVRFDPLHLREVVVNLLSNALRYASGQEGSIHIVAWSPHVNRLELHVRDDGPAIKPEVRAHLFEPFYTTSSKGTGLGLYLARELCLNNGAMLDYEYRMDILNNDVAEASGRFVITFAVPARL